MSVESQGIDPYDTVLADLRARRDQIDQAIQAIESIRSGPVISGSAAMGATVRPVADIDVDGPGALLGLSSALQSSAGSKEDHRAA